MSIAGHDPYNQFILNRLQWEFHHNVIANNRTYGFVCG